MCKHVACMRVQVSMHVACTNVCASVHAYGMRACECKCASTHLKSKSTCYQELYMGKNMYESNILYTLIHKLLADIY